MALLLTALNAVLDPLFIFDSLGPLPPCLGPLLGGATVPGLGLGAAGAALGTAVAS
jgi:Na+-driven multidrug efflux pump